MFAADSMGVPAFVFTQLLSKAKERNSRSKGEKKQNLTWNSHSRSCILGLGSVKIRRYITMLALLKKLPLSTNPLLFDAPSSRNPTNICTNLILNKVKSLGYIFAADSMGLSSLKFSWWAPKDTFCAIECITVVQGHPRSLILASIERSYMRLPISHYR